MKYILALIVCFVFVSLVAGQGYGRVRDPKKQTVVHPRRQPPVVDPWRMGNPIGSLRGGRFDVMPPEIVSILGSTINNIPMVGGRNDLPAHGGSGTDPSGLRNGWGADPNAPLISAVSNWESPMGNAEYPMDFAGEELVYDPATNRYVRKHQQAKQTQYIQAQEGHIMPGGGPFDSSSFQPEHNIVKEATHIATKTIGGISPVVGGPIGNQVGHNVEKQIVGQQMHNAGKIGIQNHNIVKSSGMISAGKPSYLGSGPKKAGIIGQNNHAVIGHNIDKSSGPAIGFINPTGHVVQDIAHNTVKSVGGGMISAGKPSFFDNGPIDAGIIGPNNQGAISHNIGKATHGVDSMIGHNIAKSSGPVAGVGFIDPTGHVAQGMAGGGVISAGKPSYIGSGPMHVGSGAQNFGPFGGPKKTPLGGIQTDPVHNVGKISRSGMFEGVHDSLAVAIGGVIAQNAMLNSADAVNMGSNGRLVNGDPRAIAATQHLAGEAVHVAGKTLGIASQSNPISKNGPIGVGKGIFGGGVHQQPIHAESFFTQPIQTDPFFVQPVPPKPVFTQPKPVFTQPKPVFTQPKPVFTQPKPVFTQPKPVFTQPKPVFTQPKPVFTQPRPVFTQPKPVFKQQVHPKPVVKKPQPLFTGGYGRRRV